MTVRPGVPMDEPPQIPKHPLFVVSKIIAVVTSAVLYSGFLALVYFVGCRGEVTTDARRPTGVSFTE